MMPVGLEHYLTLSAILFAISVAGIFLNRKNVILLLMCVELLLLAVNFNFIAFSRQLDDTAGQVFVFFILTVAAAEAAIGLAIPSMMAPSTPPQKPPAIAKLPLILNEPYSSKILAYH